MTTEVERSEARAWDLLAEVERLTDERDRLEDEAQHAREARGNAEVALENERRWVERLTKERDGCQESCVHLPSCALSTPTEETP